MIHPAADRRLGLGTTAFKCVWAPYAAIKGRPCPPANCGLPRLLSRYSGCPIWRAGGLEPVEVRSSNPAQSRSTSFRWMRTIAADSRSDRIVPGKEPGLGRASRNLRQISELSSLVVTPSVAGGQRMRAVVRQRPNLSVTTAAYSLPPWPQERRQRSKSRQASTIASWSHHQ